MAALRLSKVSEVHVYHEGRNRQADVVLKDPPPGMPSIIGSPEINPARQSALAGAIETLSMWRLPTRCRCRAPRPKEQDRPLAGVCDTRFPATRKALWHGQRRSLFKTIREARTSGWTLRHKFNAYFFLPTPAQTDTLTLPLIR